MRLSWYRLPSFALYIMRTAWALMVMPRSRSRSISSSTWACISRSLTEPVNSRRRSESVDLPWSMWAMMAKLRKKRASIQSRPRRFLRQWIKRNRSLDAPAVASPHGLAYHRHRVFLSIRQGLKAAARSAVRILMSFIRYCSAGWIATAVVLAGGRPPQPAKSPAAPPQATAPALPEPPPPPAPVQDSQQSLRDRNVQEL